MKRPSRSFLIFVTAPGINQKAFTTDEMQRPRVIVTTDGDICLRNLYI